MERILIDEMKFMELLENRGLSLSAGAERALKDASISCSVDMNAEQLTDILDGKRNAVLMERERDVYKTIIELDQDIGVSDLCVLRSVIEGAFANRSGKAENKSDDPLRFIFEGGEKLYGCLNLGNLSLNEEPLFKQWVRLWRWEDIIPDEDCDILASYKRVDERNEVRFG